MFVGTTLQLTESLSRSYYYTGSRLIYIDSTTVANAPQSVTRSWITPEQAKNNDCAIQEVWVDLLYAEDSTHNLKLEVFLDFDDSQVIQAEWSPSELQDLIQGGRITLGLNLHASVCRSFKLRVSTTAGTPMRLIRASVIYRAFQGSQRRALRAGSLK